jgi:hypothetical protein
MPSHTVRTGRGTRRRPQGGSPPSGARMTGRMTGGSRAATREHPRPGARAAGPAGGAAAAQGGRGPLLALARTLGNRRLGAALQGELRVGRADDAAEREAQAAARHLVRGEAAPAPGRAAGLPSAGAVVAPELAAEIARGRRGGRPLPAPLRAFFERGLGTELGGVRVHEGPRAWAVADALRARAFAVDDQVWLGRGERTGRTPLLAHELTHVARHRAAGGAPVVRRDPQPRPRNEVTLTFPNDHVERRRVVRICTGGVLHFDPVGQAPMSAFRSIAFEGGILVPSQATAELVERFHRAVGLQPEPCAAAPAAAAAGPSCACASATRVAYDAETFRFIGSLRGVISGRAARGGVPAGAVAGAIADEYDTRRGLRAAVDAGQDAVIDALPEFSIDLDRFFDIRAKLLNTLENDVGPANIKVRTALELVQRGELAVPGSPPSDVQVNRIVDFLLTETGTVEATVAVIRRASTLFGAGLSAYPAALREAVLMDYFKQGDSYYRRYAAARAASAAHQPCPGDDGCQFIHNRPALVTALTPRPGIVRTGPGTTMVVPDVEAWERMTRPRSAFE